MANYPMVPRYLAHQKKQSITRLQFTPINEYISDIPHWVDKAIRTAMQLSPAQRYEESSEFEADLKKTNPAYLKEQQLPLLDRNPIAFWRSISTLLFLVNLGLLYLLLR